MDDFKTLAQSPHSLTVCGAPEGFDALIFCDALRARGGVGLYIATDEARASAFAAAARFFAPDLPVLRLLGWDCNPMTGSAPARVRRRVGPGRCMRWPNGTPRTTVRFW